MAHVWRAILRRGAEEGMIDAEGANSPALPGPQAILRLVGTIIVILVGFVLAAPSNCYPALQRIASDFDMLDGSWQLELPARLARGEFAGTGFVFTYGPIYQVMHALGLLVPPGDLASLIRFQMLPECLLTMVCVWLLLNLTGAPLKWRALTYLLWACLWPPMSNDLIGGIKPIAGLLLIAICGRALVASGDPERRMVRMQEVLLWALTAPALVLYAFDLGIMTLIALMFTAASVLLCAWSHLRNGETGVWWRTASCASAAILAALAFAAGLSLASGWNRYLRDSWQIVSGYSVMMPFEINWINLTALLVAFCCGITVTLLASYRLRVSLRSKDLAASKRALSLLATACFCIVWLRSGLTRADGSHVINALIPTLFLVGCLLPCYFRTEWISLARPAFASLLLVLPLSTIVVDTLIGSRKPTITHRLAAIRSLELRGAELSISQGTIRRANSVARGLPGDMLYVWPYETIINVVTNKGNPVYTLQGYAATTDSLERATVARLESVQDLPVMVITNSYLIDGVENLTRTPLIFRYLLDHYELTGSRDESFVLLQRRSPEQQRWQEQELPISTGSFSPGDDRSLMVNIVAGSNNDCRASDLLMLRLRAAKTRLYGVGKPGQIFMTFYLSNGEQRTQKLLLPPDGETHGVLVSAATLKDPLFLSIFTPNRLWRSRERIVALQLKWTRLDWLTVRPREVALDGISVLRREKAEVLEAPLANQAAFLNWCYGEGTR